MDTSSWVSADAWHRRDVGDGTYLMVSRTRVLGGCWHWRRHVLHTGRCLAKGPAGCRSSYPTATAAKAAADESARVAALDLAPLRRVEGCDDSALESQGRRAS